MKHILFNLLMRNIYGDKLTAEVQRFVIAYIESSKGKLEKEVFTLTMPNES